MRLQAVRDQRALPTTESFYKHASEVPTIGGSLRCPPLQLGSCGGRKSSTLVAGKRF